MERILKALRQWFEDFFIFGGWVTALEWGLILLVFAVHLAAVCGIVWFATELIDAIN